MRHRALQTGRVYVHQNPHDGHLSVDEMRQMVSSSDTFSNRVLHFGACLRGTRQFWFKQKSRLVAMVDTLGLPTVFFTHSAADLQWPELARLLGVEDNDNSTARSKAVIENPCLADWFFYHRIIKFMDVFYKGILKATEGLLAPIRIPAQRQSSCPWCGLARRCTRCRKGIGIQ